MKLLKLISALHKINPEILGIRLDGEQIKVNHIHKSIKEATVTGCRIAEYFTRELGYLVSVQVRYRDGAKIRELPCAVALSSHYSNKPANVTDRY